MDGLTAFLDPHGGFSGTLRGDARRLANSLATIGGRGVWRRCVRRAQLQLSLEVSAKQDRAVYDSVLEAPL